MNQIAAKIASELGTGQPVNLQKLLAWVSMTIGLTNKTAMVYINTMSTVYGWNVEEEKITFSELVK